MSKKKISDDPRDELVAAVIEMYKQIEKACNKDHEWTSWEGNGTNAHEAWNVIRPLKKIAERCK